MLHSFLDAGQNFQGPVPFTHSGIDHTEGYGGDRIYAAGEDPFFLQGQSDYPADPDTTQESWS